jgi:transcriptional regulator with XRE-family HTH domain
VTGKEIKRARKVLGVSQIELAEKLGVHPMTVSRWERDFVKIPEPEARLVSLLVKTAPTQSRRSKG